MRNQHRLDTLREKINGFFLARKDSELEGQDYRLKQLGGLGRRGDGGALRDASEARAPEAHAAARRPSLSLLFFLVSRFRSPLRDKKPDSPPEGASERCQC